MVNRNKRKLEKTEERFASSVANADSGTTTSTPKKRRKTEAVPLDFSGISPILAGAPDHRGDAHSRDQTVIPNTQINSEGEIIEEKESPDSPDETMIPAHEIDPPMPESPLFPPSEPNRPPPKKRYAKKTKKCRRKLFESNTSNSDSELSSKNYVPIPSETNSPQTVKSENDKEESMDLMTEMFGPAENELRPTQVYGSWAEATVPFDEMID